MLRIFQIWYDDESRKNCFDHPAVTPYHNAILTPYFESQVILDLRPYSTDYVGVWSHKAKLKIARDGNDHFTMDRLVRICEVGDFDVLGFQHPHRQLNVLYDSVRFKFDAMFDYLMKRLGVAFDSKTRPRFTILQNHFVARAHVMNGYAEFLERAVSIMESDKPLKAELDQRAPYRTDSATKYTFHPFICEKLVSAYLHVNSRLFCRYYREREAVLFGTGPHPA